MRLRHGDTMEHGSRIMVAGHKGLVGSAMVRRLHASGFVDLTLCGREEVDMWDQMATERLFSREKPEYVFPAAAMVAW